MRNGLWALHKIGIYPMDIAPRNYRGGLLVDLGQSWTPPHVFYSIFPNWQRDAELESGLSLFDDMIRCEAAKPK